MKAWPEEQLPCQSEPDAWTGVQASEQSTDEWMSLTPDEQAERGDLTLRAQMTCLALCPARSTCLVYGMLDTKHNIYAGYNARERYRILRGVPLNQPQNRSNLVPAWAMDEFLAGTSRATLARRLGVKLSTVTLGLRTIMWQMRADADPHWFAPRRSSVRAA